MKGFKIIASSLLCLGLLTGMWGCHGSTIIISDDPHVNRAPEPAPQPGPPPWAPAHGHRAKHQYHYYPATYVYFDVGRSLYFYLYGDQWRVSASLPVGIRINVTEYVVLDMDDERPYRYHPEVTRRYPPGHRKKLDKEDDDDHDEKHRGRGRRD